MVIIYRKPLVGIDCNTEETRVGVNEENFISGLQIVDDRSFRKIGHVSHIFQKFVFWRILWFNIFFLEHLHFTINKSFDFDLLDLGLFISLFFTSLLTLGVTSFSVWNPTGCSTFKWSISDINQCDIIET